MSDLSIECRPNVSPEQMVANMRSALSRGLREVPACVPHGESLAVAAGGPSLADTYKDLEAQGHVAAVNGSLGFLLDHGIVPAFCGVLDSSPHMADVVAADPRVRYLVASNCDPALFDKLLDAKCRVWLWHPTPASIGTNAGAELLKELRPETWTMVAGGCTMGLRWVSLGYLLGYREFHLHGLDSSFRDDKTHAYADRRSNKAWIDESSLEINGYRTSLNFMQQVTDCAMMLARFQKPDMEPTTIEIYGDGLLQSCWRNWKENRDRMSPSEAFLRWDGSEPASAPHIRAGEVLDRLPDHDVTGAEIGVFSGRMSRALLSRKDLTLLMVDSWEGDGAAYLERGQDWHAELTEDEQKRFMEAALHNTDSAADRRTVVRRRSLDAAGDVAEESLDFVFLDADHSRPGCLADIMAWWPKVKKTGFLCGHDYGNPMFPGVKAAVDAFAASAGLNLAFGRDMTWFAAKD